MFSPTELLLGIRERGVRSRSHPRHRSSYPTLGTTIGGRLHATTCGSWTGTGSGPFIERLSDHHLDLASTTADPAGWYDDFDAYFSASLHAEISGDIEAITGSDNEELVRLGRKLTPILGDKQPSQRSSISPQVASLREDIRALLEQRRAEIGKIINRTVNRVVLNDPSFLLGLKQEIEAEAERLEDSQEDADDDASSTTTKRKRCPPVLSAASKRDPATNVR